MPPLVRIVLENKNKKHGENYKTICRFYGICILQKIVQKRRLKR